MKKKKKNILHGQLDPFVGAHPIWSAFSRWRSNPIKLAYSLNQL